MEMELREELDLVQAKVREAERARNSAYEIIADHEATIQKFRSLVSQVFTFCCLLMLGVNVINMLPNSQSGAEQLWLRTG